MWQTIPGGSQFSVNTSITEYVALRNRQNNNWASNQANRRQIVASDGRFLRLLVSLSAAPGNSGAYTFSMRKNNADAGLAVTITDPDTTGANYGESNSYAPGNKVNLQCAPSASPAPTNTPGAHYCAVWWDDAINRAIKLFGHQNAMHNTFSEYNYGEGGDVWAALGAGNVAPAGINGQDGTLRDFYGQLNAGAGSGASKGYDLRLRDGTTNTGININFRNNATTGNDTTDTYAVTSGSHSIRMFAKPTAFPNTPTARYFFGGYVFETDEAHSYDVVGGSVDPLPSSNGTSEYNEVNAADQTWNATNIFRNQITDCSTWSHLYVVTSNPPGSGTSWDFTLMVNETATPLTVNIADADTSGSITDVYVETDPFDRVSLECTSNGNTDNNTNAIWGFRNRSNLLFQNGQQLLGMGI